MFLFARELLLIRISAIFDHIWESKAQNPPKKWEDAESVYKTLYLCDRNLLRIKENLAFDMKNILLWFRTNSLKLMQGNSNL